ncbi:VOC family protein [uncultured Paracoccus sp.]|uniref:VOC family protein n=1 Tax=uncultured Paracoccus sp. TaxID=189685 RepID=UPI00260D084B|nr:VOC family protein [uncultured Paracoccus sp.]
MQIHEVFAYLRARDGEAAIAFYKAAFGATEKFRLVEPGGRLGHAELMFGDTIIMLSEEFPEYGIHAPDPAARGTFAIHLHVDDADAMIAKAVDLGATLVRAPADAFHGERSGTIRDPFGYDWIIGHSIEEITPEEMQRRYSASGGKET